MDQSLGATKVEICLVGVVVTLTAGRHCPAASPRLLSLRVKRLLLSAAFTAANPCQGSVATLPFALVLFRARLGSPQRGQGAAQRHQTERRAAGCRAVAPSFVAAADWAAGQVVAALVAACTGSDPGVSESL